VLSGGGALKERLGVRRDSHVLRVWPSGISGEIIHVRENRYSGKNENEREEERLGVRRDSHVL